MLFIHQKRRVGLAVQSTVTSADESVVSQEGGLVCRVETTIFTANVQIYR